MLALWGFGLPVHRALGMWCFIQTSFAHSQEENDFWRCILPQAWERAAPPICTMLWLVTISMLPVLESHILRVLIL
jgi:hypothetical protein